MTTYNDKINIVYREEQSIQNSVGFSKSPNKPARLLQFLQDKNLAGHFQISTDWEPFAEKDFYLAHTKEYVDGFFSGNGRLRNSNGLEWNAEFAESVRYTNASLYQAVRRSLLHPETVQFSPTSGFHHATPERGGGFCTFSGQVIASRKIWEEFGKKGAYIDLDGHFGNSIEDSKSFVSGLSNFIVHNINPAGSHQDYIRSFQKYLEILKNDLLSGRVDYVVFCHGADSHEWDDLGQQCTTEEWIQCSKLFYSMIKNVSESLGKPVPVSLSLFGGYRSDDYNSVLNLHTADLSECLSILCNQDTGFIPQILEKGLILV